MNRPRVAADGAVRHPSDAAQASASRRTHIQHDPATSRELGAFEGSDAGPTLIVIGGLHANEPAGLDAARIVLDRLERESPAGFRGRVVALVGHVRGRRLAAPTPRYVDRDLNRLFTAAEVARVRAAVADERGVEDREMLELLDAIEQEVELARGPVFALDLHTTSADSPPFLFVQDSILVREIARQLPVPLVLGIEEDLSGLLMDYLTEQYHLGTVVFESGRHDDPRSVDLHAAALWMILDAVGMLPLDAIPHEPAPADELRRAAGARSGRVYDIRHRHPVVGSTFSVSERLDVYQRVVADWTEVAIEDGMIVHSPVAGLLFMPNRQREIRPGDDGFFIVRRVGRIWLRVSAWLRRPARAHAMLAHVPGVARLPGSDTALLVDPEVAAFLKRRIFHLIGYRLLHRGADPRGHAIRRLVHAVTASCRHGWQRLRKRPSPPLHPAEPDDPHVWIIDRRTLDLHPIRRGGRAAGNAMQDRIEGRG